MIKTTILCIAMIFIQCLTLASPQDAGREAAALKVKKLARKLEKTVRERKERWLPEKRQLAGTNIYIRWTSGKKAVREHRNIETIEAALDSSDPELQFWGVICWRGGDGSQGGVPDQWLSLLPKIKKLAIDGDERTR